MNRLTTNVDIYLWTCAYCTLRLTSHCSAHCNKEGPHFLVIQTLRQNSNSFLAMWCCLVFELSVLLPHIGIHWPEIASSLTSNNVQYGRSLINLRSSLWRVESCTLSMNWSLRASHGSDKAWEDCWSAAFKSWDKAWENLPHLIVCINKIHVTAVVLCIYL